MPLRDYTKFERQNCQLVTHYEGKEFCGPRVTTGPNEIFIADNGSNNREVIIFDKDLNLIRTFGEGSGDSQLNNPKGIAVGHVIAVSEYDDNVVKKYSLQGNYLSKIGSNGNENGQFNHPRGLCFNSKGLLYVVDTDNFRVQVFREDNTFQLKFGSEGDNPGQFKEPCYIAVDSSDQVYVTDSRNDDGGIIVFSEDGYFIKKINCTNPWAIAIAPDDYIITDDHEKNVLTVFNPTHELVAKLGGTGEEKGQFDSIQSIAINNSGTIFVTELHTHRLQIITS